MSILIVEDDERVADFLERGLKAEGYAITSARDGASGFNLVLSNSFELVILDLMLPMMHGLEVCQELRAQGKFVPILMLTAMDSLEDKIEGLRLGADDYLTKPFAFDELVARVEALIRRGQSFNIKPSVLSVGGLSFDRETLDVRNNGRQVDLTSKELAILELLMSTPGKVFSRERILSNVWGASVDPLTNVVDVYIGKLRKKIDGGAEAPLIKTVRGRGYRLARDGDEVLENRE